MDKKWIILLITAVIIMAMIIIFFIQRSKVEFHSDGDTFSVIGGADGPTAVFIAGKVGDTEIEKKSKEIPVVTEEIMISVGENTFALEPADSVAFSELKELLREGDIHMPASNYGGFEKVCKLGKSITREDKQITTTPGDVMLYNGNQIVIFYGSNSWAYTPIGKLHDTQEMLEKAFSGDESEVILHLNVYDIEE